MPVSAEQPFETFFAATSDCQFYAEPDANGRFRYVHVNPAALAVAGMQDEAQIIGLTPREALGSEYGETVERNIAKTFSDAEAYHFNGSLGTAPNAPRYDALYIPLFDGVGTVAGVLGSARNISEISSLNERLLHAQRLEALGELAGSMAHDFNNILAIFRGALRLLERDDLETTKKEICYEEAHKALDNGVALTSRLTAFARKEKIQAVPCDVADLISSCLLMVRGVLGKRITLSFDHEPHMWRARCDKNEFEIALMNLASNARDAMEGAGEVLISARNNVRVPSDPATFPAEFVEITMQDCGCGMSEDDAKRAIEPFFTTKAEGYGTGLGLSSIAKFATDVGGAVRISSELGQGTTVSILLPRW